MLPRLVALSVVVLLLGATGAAGGPRVAYSLIGTHGGRPAVLEWTGRSRLLLAEAGRWRDATPPRIPGPIQDVFFLDRGHGWLLASDCASARGALFRTRDAGRTWQRLPGRWTRNCSAGTGFSLHFVDEEHGWLLYVDPHAARLAQLYRTTSAGRSWRLVAGDRDLRSDAPVRFVTRTHGWQQTTWLGWPRVGPVSRSVDAGRSWRRDRGLPADRRYSSPVLVGRNALIAGSRGGEIAVYRSRRADRWRRVSRHSGPRPIEDIVLSAPSGDALWLASGPRRRLRTLFVSRDAGRTWSRRALPDRTDDLVALSPVRAWATAGGRLWATSDGGLSWRAVAPTP